MQEQQEYIEISIGFDKLYRELTQLIDMMNEEGMYISLEDPIIRRYVSKDDTTNKYFINKDKLKKDYFDINFKDIGIQ